MKALKSLLIALLCIALLLGLAALAFIPIILYPVIVPIILLGVIVAIVWGLVYDHMYSDRAYRQHRRTYEQT